MRQRQEEAESVREQRGEVSNGPPFRFGFWGGETLLPTPGRRGPRFLGELASESQTPGYLSERPGLLEAQMPASLLSRFCGAPSIPREAISSPTY